MTQRQISQTYSIYGNTIRFIFNEKKMYDRVVNILTEFNFMHPVRYDSSHADRPIVIIVWQRKVLIPIRYKKIIRLRLYDVEVWHGNNDFIFKGDKTIFWIHPKNSKGFLYLEREIPFRQILLNGILELLRWRGLYPLHASGVVQKNSKILLLGSSGCGKSTVTASLFSQGYRFLSDELVFIKKTDSVVHILPVFHTLKFYPEIFYKQNPLLKNQKYTKAYIQKNKEIIINIHLAYPYWIAHSFIPNAILFLKITHNRKSVLMPIPKRLALFKLINQSATLFMGGEPSQKHLDVLRRLLTQAVTFQLLLGQDLYRDPLRVKDIVSTIKVGSPS